MAETDPHALETLYDRHVRAMYGLALRILQNHGEAQAVVQAVFTDAWSGMQAPDGGPEPPAARFIEATRRRAVEQLRARSASAGGDPAVVDMPRPAIADGDKPLAADAIARLRSGLAALPLVERAAIELAALEGLTAAQIAKRLELRPETVKTRVRDGLLSLRETLTA